MSELELYKKYRPTTFKDVLGQNVTSLAKQIKKNKLPHSILFVGPSGCGKTTIARVLAKKLNCGEQDLYEVNSADFRGIDTIRNINLRIKQAPIAGDVLVWIIDECHKLTNDAQNALLKTLEDTPRHSYLFLCTTQPNNLIKEIHTRCQKQVLTSLPDSDIESLVKHVAKQEGLKVNSKVVDRIVEFSDGSARQALVYLGQAAVQTSQKEMLDSIQRIATEEDAIVICRMLIKGVTWATMAKQLKNTNLSDYEGLRRMILKYCQSCIIGASGIASTAYLVFDSFREPFYNTGEAGFVAACYEVVTSRS